MTSSIQSRLASLQAGDYISLFNLFKTVEGDEGDVVDYFLPSFVTTEGLISFAQKHMGDNDVEMIIHDILRVAITRLLYLNYEAILVVAARCEMTSVFALLVDNGIDHRICADEVLAEIGQNQSDAKVAMFHKFVAEKLALVEQRTIYEGRIPRIIPCINGAFCLGFEHERLFEIWKRNECPRLLEYAIQMGNEKAIGYLVHSSLCISAEDPTNRCIQSFLQEIRALHHQTFEDVYNTDDE